MAVCGRYVPMYIIFYVLLNSDMIHLSGSIVRVKIALDFELGSLMKSMLVVSRIPCLVELSGQT